MKYERLTFDQYFIDTSNDFNKTGKARYKIKYNKVYYGYKGQKCEANWEAHLEDNVIQINFEQTNGKLDWMCNLLFLSKYYDTFMYNGKKITLRVHDGWKAMYKAMKHQVRDKVKELLKIAPEAEIEVIGWSLGSGMAMLCAQDIFYNFNKKVHLFTYGSTNPFKTNIFNRRRIRNYLRDCCKEVYNFSDRNDIVTYLPPRLFGFIKIRRVSVGGLFNPFKLFNAKKYHTHYDDKKLYRKIK